ncbi:MAG TPA: ATP-binding protein [Accumulibacter sp.]|uniref:ATP-binding protein n=1 Tax=Accumulibacter sp. TaxID=2053492 RepID=UPI002CB305A5|nr:ATP-binding protein [Accumulibacter sp.]HRF73643.1 ATP-binding protein [Accumulibacter sp.]
MKRSLQRQLSLMLGSVIVIAGLVAAIASFALGYSEAKEFQDDMLRQIASLNASAGVASWLPEGSPQSSPKIKLNDPESRITIIHLPRDERPDWLAADLRSGFRTVRAGTERLRVFILDGASGKRTVVMQPTEARDEVAVNSALHTLIPLLLLIPVLTVLIVRVVRRELAPITRLSRGLDEQPADHPQAIAADGLPEEITPFVHAINRLLERVNHLLGQQRRFVADAAHELRSPLTALSVQIQNLAHAGSLDAVGERVRPLQAGIERARQLTEQLLNLARTQAGSNGQTEVDVSLLARELIADLLPFAEDKGIDLGLDEITPLRIRGAPEAFRLIIRNALENALKYTPEGGEVTLRLRSGDQCTTIEVVDNGPGIPALERERVFDSFYRIPGNGSEGSGLGLTIAREAATRLGGTVSLHARHEGSGLLFRYRQGRPPE